MLFFLIFILTLPSLLTHHSAEELMKLLHHQSTVPLAVVRHLASESLNILHGSLAFELQELGHLESDLISFASTVSDATPIWLELPPAPEAFVTRAQEPEIRIQRVTCESHPGFPLNSLLKVCISFRR